MSNENKLFGKQPINLALKNLRFKRKKLLFGLIAGLVTLSILTISVYYLVMINSKESLVITIPEGQQKTSSIPLAGLGLYGMLVKNGKIFLAPEAGVLTDMGVKGVISKFWQSVGNNAPLRAELEAQGIPARSLLDPSRVEVQVVNKLPESPANPYKYIGTPDPETGELVRPFNPNKYQATYDSANNELFVQPINDARDPAKLNPDSLRNLFSEESVNKGLPPIPGDAKITVGEKLNMSYGLEPLNFAPERTTVTIRRISDDEVRLYPINNGDFKGLTEAGRESFIKKYNEAFSESPLPEDAKITVGERITRGPDGKWIPYDQYNRDYTRLGTIDASDGLAPLDLSGQGQNSKSLRIDGPYGLEPLDLSNQGQNSKIPAIVAGTAVGGTFASITDDSNASPTVSISDTLPSTNQSFQTFTQGNSIFMFDPNSGRVTQMDNGGQIKEIYSEWGKTGSDYNPEAGRSFLDAQSLAKDQPLPPEYYLSPTESKIDSYLGQFSENLSMLTDAVGLSPLAALPFGSAAAATMLESTATLVNPLIAAIATPPALWETYKAVKRDLNDPVMIKRAEEMAKIPALTPEQELGVGSPTSQSTDSTPAEGTASVQKEKDSAPPDITQSPEADRGLNTRVNAGGQREETPPGASMLPDYWEGSVKGTPAPNNNPPIPPPTQVAQQEPSPAQPIAGAENFGRGNGSEEQPFELTEEAIAKIYQYDPQTNEIRLRDDWKDRLERNGTGSWVKGVDTQKITDALVKAGDMTEDEQTNFMEKTDRESIKAPDGTETRNTKTGQESTNDQDDKPDTVKKPGETLFQT